MAKTLNPEYAANTLHYAKYEIVGKEKAMGNTPAQKRQKELRGKRRENASSQTTHEPLQYQLVGQ